MNLNRQLAAVVHGRPANYEAAADDATEATEAPYEMADMGRERQDSHSPPPPATSLMSSPVIRTVRRRIGYRRCADNSCGTYCEHFECLYCAVHCTGTPRTDPVCPVHYDYPFRCKVDTEWCMNHYPADGSCADSLCAMHCNNPACERHCQRQQRPSTNRSRGLRTQR